MKAKTIALLVLVLFLFISVLVFTETDTYNHAVREGVNLDLARGQSWEKTFNTRRIWGENHNAVHIEVSSVKSGKYKVIVTGSNGYHAETEELTGPYLTFLEKADPDVTYTIVVASQGEDNLKARLNVISNRW